MRSFDRDENPVSLHPVMEKQRKQEQLHVLEIPRMHVILHKETDNNEVLERCVEIIRTALADDNQPTGQGAGGGYFSVFFSTPTFDSLDDKPWRKWFPPEYVHVKGGNGSIHEIVPGDLASMEPWAQSFEPQTSSAPTSASK
jgi:hypothetical protein